MNFALIFLGIVSYFFYFCSRSDAVRSWDFEWLDFGIESSDDNLANVSSKMEHLGLGKTVVSVTFDWRFDTDENTRLEMKMFSCQSGRDADYKEQAYKIPNITFFEFLDKYYMKVIYADFASCSNIPDIGEKFVPPWKKMLYVFNRCDPQAKNYPEILPRGYYKMEFKIVGQAEILFKITTKLTPKGIM